MRSRIAPFVFGLFVVVLQGCSAPITELHAKPDGVAADLSDCWTSQEEVAAIVGADRFLTLNNRGFDAWDGMGDILGPLSVFLGIPVICLLVVVFDKDVNKSTRRRTLTCALLFASPVLVPFVYTTCQHYALLRSVSRLNGLLTKAVQLNEAIQQIHVVDQLAAAGNPVRIDNRGYVVSQIRVSKANLVKAIKTDAILLEHPDFNQNSLSNARITLTKEVADANIEAGDLTDVLNRTLEINSYAIDDLKEMLAAGMSAEYVESGSRLYPGAGPATPAPPAEGEAANWAPATDEGEKSGAEAATPAVP